MTVPLIDHDARVRAAQDAGTTLLVTAGAGTGKTTLLVDRLLEQVLGGGIPVDEIVALTFTQKAANEMRVRVLALLDRILAEIEGRPLADADRVAAQERLEGWMGRHRLKRDTIAERARAAVAGLDRALIETIHGFAAHLLRLYPVEARIDPGFEVDAGEGFEVLFEREWERWLEVELAAGSARGAAWTGVLQEVGLEVLEEAARALGGFSIPLDRLDASGDTPGVRERLAAFASEVRERLGKTLTACTKRSLSLYRQMEVFAQALDDWAAGRPFDPEAGAQVRRSLQKPGKGWSGAAAEEAEAAAAAARALLRDLLASDPALIGRALGLVRPFAEDFRRRYLQAGFVSFDGLLVLARDLVRDDPRVRGELKRAFRAILVDEFQDTDPVQYEVLFYLAERAGAFARDIRHVELEPGKLFIVGDPKQSIYAFRRADIEAFDEVRSRIASGGGKLLDLQANFRSHSGITGAVNGIFRELIRPYRRLQPEYRDIHARRDPERPGQSVELVHVAREGETISAEEARRAQAEWLARWITAEVGTAVVPSAAGGVRPLAFRDVALLFRSLSSVHVYLEALRRAEVPYVVEGEKYFYSNQEILDFMNLLRAVENPHDLVALAGFLRSAYGGLTDEEVRQWIERGLTDFRRPLPDDAPGGPRLARLFADLAELHAGMGRWPLERLLREVLERTFFLEVTAGAYQGEQKLANLLKLKRMAEEMGREGETTLRRFIAAVQRRIEDATEEGESPLADETLDAVKILSIHKAKGLEFPVVFLANLHADLPTGEKAVTRIVYDWTDRVVGVDLAGLRNLGSVLLAQKERERQAEEEKRVLYVAMTRARERLILLGSETNRDKSPQAMVLGVLSPGGVPAAAETVLERGEARVICRRWVWDGARGPAGSPRPEKGERLPAWPAFARTWEDRRTRVQPAPAEPRVETSPEEKARLALGTLCHRALEWLDFSRAERALDDALARACIGVEGSARALDDARAILRGFVRSQAFAELRRAKVLGREVPVIVQDPATGEPVERRLDILYRAGSRLVIGDYKTDRVDPARAEEEARRHAEQGGAYAAAVASALAVPAPEFRVYFLRTGQSVRVEPAPDSGAPAPPGDPPRGPTRKRNPKRS